MIQRKTASRMAVGSAALLTAVVLGCGAAPAGRGRDAAPHYFRTIGEASATDISERGGRILRQFGYDLRREQAPPALEVESEWKIRRPFDDERSSGAESAQSRVVLRGRQRSSLGNLVLYNVEVNVENQVQMNGAREWTFTPMSPRFKLHADSIAVELERELRNVTRR